MEVPHAGRLPQVQVIGAQVAHDAPVGEDVPVVVVPAADEDHGGAGAAPGNRADPVHEHLPVSQPLKHEGAERVVPDDAHETGGRAESGEAAGGDGHRAADGHRGAPGEVLPLAESEVGDRRHDDVRVDLTEHQDRRVPVRRGHLPIPDVSPRTKVRWVSR